MADRGFVILLTKLRETGVAGHKRNAGLFGGKKLRTIRNGGPGRQRVSINDVWIEDYPSPATVGAVP
jgi:hypothetical protein